MKKRRRTLQNETEMVDLPEGSRQHFLIFLVVLQQLEGNVIYPRVMGSSLGLPTIWVMAAVTVGGGVMGVLGMLLGIPLAVTIYHLVRNDVNKADSGLTNG